MKRGLLIVEQPSPSPKQASPTGSGAPELVVLVDDTGTATGTAAKHLVHSRDTPLHLAFSCHVTRPDGAVLVTRRALSKQTWPGVWTNSFCGHPAPGEPIEHAIARRAAHELGITVREITPLLPNFRYRAVDASGIVEHEICPVFAAVADTEPTPNPHEVMDVRWVQPDQLANATAATPWAFSPWLVWQLAELAQQPAADAAAAAATGQTGERTA